MKDYSTFDAIGDMLAIYAIVIVISMLVAAIVRGIVIVLSKQADKQATQAPAAKPAAAPAAPIVVAGVPQEHIVAISAAVASVLGAHRIVHIETPVGHGWTSEARTVHHTSHLPRH